TNIVLDQSEVENTIFPCGNMVILGDVKNGVLVSGKLIYGGMYFYSPFQIAAICSGTLPITGVLSISPVIMRNGTQAVVEFFGSGKTGLNVTVNTSSIKGFSSIQRLYDLGKEPDAVALDSIYSARFRNDNTSDASLLLFGTVDDSVGNVLSFNTSLIFDNTPPSVSLTIAGGSNISRTRSVELTLGYEDDNGIYGCRVSNYNLSGLIFRCPFDNGLVCEDMENPINTPYRSLAGGTEDKAFITSDTDTTVIWNWTSNPSANDDIINGIDTDADGNVFFAGYDKTNGVADPQFYIAKLDSSGGFAWDWTQHYNGLPSVFNDLAVDSDGDAIAAGYSYSPGNIQYHVQKIDSSGVPVWDWESNPTAGGDILYGIATDSKDGVVVAGKQFVAGANYQIYVRHLDSSGNPGWTWTSDLSGSEDVLWDVAVDKDDNTIVVGYDQSGTLWAGYVAKFDQAGAFLWEWRYDMPSYDSFSGVTTDPDGNIYAVGYERTAGINNNMLVVKLDPSGNHLWNQSYPTSTSLDSLTAVAVSSDGTVVVSGQDYSSQRAYSAGFDPYGEMLWEWAYDFSATSDYSTSIALDPDDDIILGVVDTITMTNGQFHVLKLDSSGPRQASYENNGDFPLWSGTVEMQVKFIDQPSSDPIYFFFANNTAGDATYQFYLESDMLFFSWMNETGSTVLKYNCSTCGLVADEWYHLAFSFRNVSEGNHAARLYLDGALINSTSAGTDFPHSPVDWFEIGSANDEYKGNKQINEFMISSYLKNASEIYEDFAQPTKYHFSACEPKKSWMLGNLTGNCTVWFQAMDNSGNIETTFDRINLTDFGDITPPENLELSDDGDYTNESTWLHARWHAFDPEGTVYYKYQILNETVPIAYWTSAPNFGREQEGTKTGLSLRHNHTYFFQVAAYNYNLLATTLLTDGITVDLVNPPNPRVNSSTHENYSWGSSKTARVLINGSDDLSGVYGYSYVLDKTKTTKPDNNLEIRFEKDDYWNWTYNPSIGNDMLYGVAADKYRNVFMVGLDRVPGANSRGTLIKLLANGTYAWNWTYYPGVSAWFSGVDIDNGGNAIICGESDEAGSNGLIYIAKIDPDGNHMWNYTYDVSASSDYMNDIEIGSNNTIIAAGASGIGAEREFHVIKLNHSGGLLWNWTYNPSGADEELMDVAVDRKDNVIVVGYDLFIGTPRYHLAKLDKDGNLLWNLSVEDGGIGESFNGVDTDRGNNIIVVGFAGLGHSMIFKYNPSGVQLWNKTFSPSGGANDILWDVRVDSHDNIIAVGADSSPPSDQFHIVKYDPYGNHRWNYTVDASLTGDYLRSVYIDNYDNVLASGYDNGGGDGKFHVIKISSRGAMSIRNDSEVIYGSIADGAYWFHAKTMDRAHNYGATQHYRLLVDSSPPSTPQFLTDDAVVSSSRLALQWTSASDTVSGVVGYFARIDDDSSFTSPEYEAYVGDVTSGTFDMPSNGTWYASVRAINNASLNGTWSNQVQKTIDQIPPNIRVQKPKGGGVSVSSEPLFVLMTNEPAVCSYVLSTGPTKYEMSYTGTYYHESRHQYILPDAPYTVTFTCADQVGNMNSTAASAFTIDSIRTVNAVSWQTTPSSFVNVIANATIRVVDVNPDGLSGLSPDRFSLFIGGVTAMDIGVEDLDDGYYKLTFRSPLKKGIYQVSAYVDGVISGTLPNMDVKDVKFYTTFIGNMAGLTRGDFMVYGDSSSNRFGVATDTIKRESNLSLSPFFVGSDIGRNVFLFLAPQRFNVEKKEKYLEGQNLLDQSVPSFGLASVPDRFTITTSVNYPSIAFNKVAKAGPGRYNLMIKYNGVYLSGVNKGKINMSITFI
ncbi:hypothetical protein COV93_02340, partial [Candidatus Woesearchaeota archaeon CG11_big_fil_rev_8_21_14_0_20_43_8]